MPLPVSASRAEICRSALETMSAHAHTHHHPPAAQRRPAFVAALLVTFVFALVELSGGLWSGSLALVSDAGHMFSDAIALGSVSYTHLRAHETDSYLVCRLL